MAQADRQWIGDERRWSVRCRHCNFDWEPLPVYVRSDWEFLMLEAAQVFASCPRCYQGVTYPLPMIREDTRDV